MYRDIEHHRGEWRAALSRVDRMVLRDPVADGKALTQVANTKSLARRAAKEQANGLSLFSSLFTLILVLILFEQLACARTETTLSTLQISILFSICLCISPSVCKSISL